MIKALGAKLYAAWSYKKNQKWINRPLETQEKLLQYLIKKGKKPILEKNINFKK